MTERQTFSEQFRVPETGKKLKIQGLCSFAVDQFQAGFVYQTLYPIPTSVVTFQTFHPINLLQLSLQQLLPSLSQTGWRYCQQIR